LSQRDVGADSTRQPQIVGFLLLPGFALMSYASAIEPLRAANTLAGRPLYAWRHVSLDGSAVQASNGVEIQADHRIGDDFPLHTLFVCAGGNPTTFKHQHTLRWLRRLARRRVRIGGVSGGPYVLARAGLLSGHRCTIHWEHFPAFTEEFTDLQATRSLYVIDRDRLTCSGGISALDMMHALIEQDHGSDLAAAVSEWFLHTEVRLGSGPQRMSPRERFNVSNPRLLRAVEYMDAHLEEPVGRAKLADIAGVSVRQLERLFAKHLGSTINAHYLRIRLERARILLRQTTLPVLAVAVGTGFTAASHFSRAYRQAFSLSPKDERAPKTAPSEKRATR
jgi:transcriptional regulator GlxA family with amidase domain